MEWHSKSKSTVWARKRGARAETERSWFFAARGKNCGALLLSTKRLMLMINAFSFLLFLFLFTFFSICCSFFLPFSVHTFLLITFFCFTISFFFHSNLFISFLRFFALVLQFSFSFLLSRSWLFLIFLSFWSTIQSPLSFSSLSLSQ